MADANITFTGVTGITGGNFLMDRGVKPSMGEITCIPQTITNTVGTLNITYPGVTLTAPNSVIIRASLDGGLLKLQIADPRYWWQFSHIDGEYNVPDGEAADGTPLYKHSRQLRELMDLCLDALPYVTSFDTSAVAAVDKLPHIEWQADRADLSLQELCNDHGYVVVVRLNGVVAVVPVGVGEALPSLGVEKTVSFSVAGGVMPQKIRIACANVSYQIKLGLEAVGKDTDGKIYKINDLSYKPASGWGGFDFPNFENVSGTYKVDNKDVAKSELARQSVYRWYRFKRPVHSSSNYAPPGYQGDPAEVERDHILPLIPFLNEYEISSTEAGEKRKPRDAFVSGSFYLEDGLDENTPAGAVCATQFTLDGEHGIVKFNDPVYKYSDHKFSEADLTLTCTVNVTVSDLGAVKQYYGVTFDAGGTAGVQTIQKTELIPRVTPKYGGAEGISVVSTADNFSELDDIAAQFANAAVTKLTPENGVVVTYQGIRGIELDGVRRQVQWTVGDQGSETKASIGTEVHAFEPTYSEYLEVQQRQLESRRNRRTHQRLISATVAGVNSR